MIPVWIFAPIVVALGKTIVLGAFMTVGGAFAAATLERVDPDRETAPPRQEAVG